TEPTGIWPGMLLSAEMIAAAVLARLVPDPAFRTAAASLAAVVLARVFVRDARPAAVGAVALINRWAVARVLASLAGAFSGSLLLREEDGKAKGHGQALLGLAWIELLGALSLGWFHHLDLRMRVVAARSGAVAARALWFELQLG